MVRAMVKDAIDEQIIYQDFTRKVIYSGKASKTTDLKYLNKRDFKRLMKLASEEADIKSTSKYAIVLAGFTGARLGEVLGLTWDRVNFDEHQIKIDRTYDYHKRRGFRPTKAATSVRIVDIDGQLFDILQKLRTEQNKAYLKRGYRDKD